MQPEPVSADNKKKLMIWVTVIVAVVLVYLLVSLNKPEEQAATTSDTAATTQSTPSTDSNAAAYTDGTYTANGDYRTPETVEEISVTLTVANGTVTSASVAQTPQDRESAQYQTAFKSSYQQYVVGKKLDDIQLSRVSGSSLTSQGFNEALQIIKQQAASQS